MSTDVVLAEVVVEQIGNLRRIILNRPERLNAFTEEMHLALRDALNDARESADCRALVITGAGRGFCAGQDLGQRDPSKMTSPPDLGDTLERLYNPLVRQIRSLPVPVICAVNGVAAGAGANLALACDIVIAAQSAKFIQSFSKIGLVPDSGGTWTLTRLLGEARAKGLIMTGNPLSAAQAHEWGLIWQVVNDDDLQEEAFALAQDLSEGATLGLSLSKSAIHASASNTLDQQLDLERDSQRQAGRSNDYREGVTAFLEKRKPVYSGT